MAVGDDHPAGAHLDCEGIAPRRQLPAEFGDLTAQLGHLIHTLVGGEAM